MEYTDEEIREMDKLWRKRWLDCIYFFSSLPYQRGLWIERRFPNCIGDFTEDVCRYFDDLCIDEHYKDRILDGSITIEEFEVIKEFHLSFELYVAESNKPGWDKREDEIVNDQDWLKIVAVAGKAWISLKDSIIDEEEREFMCLLEKEFA